MAFTTTTAIVDETTVVTPDGMLNMASAPELRRVIEEAVVDGPARVVVDLAAVPFIDSSGLGALIGCLKVARDRGGDLRIASAGAQVSMVLKLSNLDRVLVSSATPEAAYRD
jgi:anti-sigma B factor antagonist